RGIDLGVLLRPVPYTPTAHLDRPAEPSPLNRRILETVMPVLEAGGSVERSFVVTSADRAVLAGLSGALARRSHRLRMQDLDGETPNRRDYGPPPGALRLRFEGSAGQGFAAFLVAGEITLHGEAN